MANNGVEIDGEMLRTLRSDRMWSLQRLARQGRDFAASIGENTGLVGPTLCRAEHGEHNPSRDTLRCAPRWPSCAPCSKAPSRPRPL
ncbi:MAG: hypothetical protein ACRD0K_10825 [Egibacteraceae bacterium]